MDKSEDSGRYELLEPYVRENVPIELAPPGRDSSTPRRTEPPAHPAGPTTTGTPLSCNRRVRPWPNPFPTGVTGQLTGFQTWTELYSLGLSRQTPDTFPQRARACRKVRHPAAASARGTSAPWGRSAGGHQPPPVPGINRHATATEWSTCRPHVLNIRGKICRLRQKLQAGLFPSQHQLGATPGKADTTTPTDRLAAQNQVGQLQLAIDSPQAHSPPDPLGQEFPPAPTPAAQEGERNKEGRPV